MGAVGTPIAVKDAASLSAELTRVADICQGCRRCFSLCPSFDVLFKGLDVAEVDGEAEKLPKKIFDDFVDLCYECKLCLPHCPYIPPHRWAVDVPHLVLESRNIRMNPRCTNGSAGFMPRNGAGLRRSRAMKKRLSWTQNYWVLTIIWGIYISS